MPCHRPIDRSGTLSNVRCLDCQTELASSPFVWVRLALISEPNPDMSAIATLMVDSDATVAMTARWQLLHRNDMAAGWFAEPLRTPARAQSKAHHFDRDW